MTVQDVEGALLLPLASRGLIAVVPYGERAGRSMNRSLLPTEELSCLPGMSPERAEEYLAGRLAAHLVMGRLGWDSGPILRGRDGRPLFPEGLTGSISHSRGLAAAFVTSEPEEFWGLDIQWYDGATFLAVSRNIAAPGERIGQLSMGAPTWVAPILADLAVRFSIKEAMRKLLFQVAGPSAGVEMLQFADILVSKEADGTTCLASRPPWQRWPPCRASWNWLSWGQHGPVLFSEGVAGCLQSAPDAWVLAWTGPQKRQVTSQHRSGEG